MVHSRVVYPPHYYIRSWHVPIRRESKSNPSSGPSSDCKTDVLGCFVEAPVKPKLALLKSYTEIIIN